MKKKTFVQERNGDLLPDEGLLVYYSARNLPCIRREAPGEVPVACVMQLFSFRWGILVPDLVGEALDHLLF